MHDCAIFHVQYLGNRRIGATFLTETKLYLLLLVNFNQVLSFGDRCRHRIIFNCMESYLNWSDRKKNENNLWDIKFGIASFHLDSTLGIVQGSSRGPFAHCWSDRKHNENNLWDIRIGIASFHFDSTLGIVQGSSRGPLLKW